jgi:hypothetical protein
VAETEAVFEAEAPGEREGVSVTLGEGVLERDAVGDAENEVDGVGL